MSFLQILAFIGGIFAAAFVGHYIPIPEDWRLRAKRQNRVTAVLVWMTVFCTWYMQDQNRDIRATARTAAELAEEVALQERIDDYDNCVDDNNLIEGETERRTRTLEDQRDFVEEMESDPPVDIDEIPDFDVNDLQDPLLRDLFVGLNAQSIAEYEAELLREREDLARMETNFESYQADHPLVNCGADPRDES